MAQAPLIQLSGVALAHGGEALFEGLDLALRRGDRVALVGRSGSGKSTLLKLLAGLVEPDRGERVVPRGVAVGYLEQDPALEGFATLGDFAARNLPAGESYRIERFAEGLKFAPETDVAVASGGERRRAALAGMLAAEPQLMLLDEPTNHLDIEAIRWLEARLDAARAGYVLVSHDRALLSSLTRVTLWVDRGEVRRRDRGFAAFEAWRDEAWAQEDAARHKLARRIAAEARWAAEGISARRRRNQGRLRELEALRARMAGQARRAEFSSMSLDEGAAGARRVIEARGISKAFGGRVVFEPLDLRIARGDRIAIVGPNGAGKTTLIRVLTRALEPDAGTVKLGANLDMAVYDQNQEALDPNATLRETLAGDREIGVRGRADQVMVRGSPRHVVGYLKEFLFSDSQARAPVRSLSGGEKARLALAMVFARSSSLLVLDEPTNSLDMETLDLLQETLGEYSGTVLLASHDRDFIDRVATATVALEGDGRAVAYPGGWSDYRAQRGDAPAAPGARPRAPAAVARDSAAKDKMKNASEHTETRSKSLTFTERHRLDALPAEIERMEAEVARLSELMADPDRFGGDPERLRRASVELAERQAAVAAAEEEWLRLEEKASGGGDGR